ncbi:MAG TPA: TonB-dependent receptor [Steroidobacteraceae bacterium]|jgi:outer membrane receptor protein involved in Fe transport|nr:TonB-dependent receptor [Steroidobacteraceae bacterium]
MKIAAYCLLGTAIAAVVGSQRAVAADAAAETANAASNELETITVTAQKRSETEQNVPLSMTTFSSAALEEKSINNFFDYATKVPNLAFAPTGDGVSTARTVSIRGISGDNVTGFYIDDTPLPDSIDPRVLDVDHIEVLRGPQGTLYGARSMGGVVRIITKEPDMNQFSATVHAGASKTARTSDGNYTGDGVVNIPLIPDHVSLRASAFYDTEAGYFKRSFCSDPAAAMALTCTPLSTTGITTLDNIGQINTYGGALGLTIKLNDALTITPRFMAQKATYNGFPLADYDTTPGNGIGYPVAGQTYVPPTKMTPNDFTQARWFNVPEGGYDSWQLSSVTVHWKTGAGELVSSSSFFNRQVWETEDESDFVYGDITSTIPGGQPEPGPISEEKSYQRFVQEVRFASDLQGPVQFVAGGFYSDFHGRLPFAAYYPPAEVPNLDNTLGGANNPNYPNLIFAQDFHSDIREPAVFGEVSYQPIDRLKLTAGLRYYSVKITSSGYEEGLATGGGPAIVSAPAETNEHGVNPKFEADYHITPDQMVYATASKGFRPGGLVPIVPPGQPGTGTDCVAALKATNPNITIQDTRFYNSDSLWNYELGTKTTWLDHRLTFDAAAFYIDWKNIQQEIPLSCGFQYIANAGAATSKGGEMELHARPTQPLELSLGVGYQNAKITEGSTASPQAAGSPVYQVPDWTGNAAVSYTVPVTGEWNLVSGGDYSYVGRSFSGNNDPSEPRERPSYRLLNARIAMAKGSLEIAFVGKNLGNEVANLGDSRSIAAETPGRPRLFVNQPRTLGVEFRQSF